MYREEFFLAHLDLFSSVINLPLFIPHLRVHPIPDLLQILFSILNVLLKAVNLLFVTAVAQFLGISIVLHLLLAYLKH